MAIEKSLKMDLPALAEMLRAKGRGKDTMLAHITPKEAALLKRRGGSGSVNPDTGLPEFEDSGSYDFSSPEPVSPTYDVVSSAPGGGNTFTPTQADTGVPVQVGSSYTPGGDAYAPVGPSGSYQSADILNQYGQTTPYVAGQTSMQQAGPAFPTVTSAPSPVAPGVVSPEQQAAAPAKTDPNAPKDFSEQLKAALTPGNLAKLGLVAGLGAYGTTQARKGAQQNQAATQEQTNIAQPYQQQGQTLISQAQRGELSPQSQQAYEAAKAQVNQGIASRGGVGATQAANQLANIYQTLLNNQYTYGLNVAQIGDNIALGAIRTSLQLDQTLNQATTNFYTQLASLAAGGSIGGQTIRISQ